MRRNQASLQYGIRKDRGALTRMPESGRVAGRVAVLLLTSLPLATLLPLAGCTNNPPPPPAKSSSPLEHVAPSPVGTSENVLQKKFALKSSAVFPFEISGPCRGAASAWDF